MSTKWPLMGESGLFGRYEAPAVKEDTPVTVVAVAELKDTLDNRTRELLGDRKMPKKVFVQGFENVYSGSPCKCGQIICWRIHFVSSEQNPQAKDQPNHAWALDDTTFHGAYCITQTYNAPKTVTLKEIL